MPRRISPRPLRAGTPDPHLSERIRSVRCRGARCLARERGRSRGADEGEEDEESDSENYEQEHGPKWPWSLIAIAIVAFVLLIAGGYGVMQQRAATQEELRQLRATLATNVNPADESASREALQELQQSYDKLAANAEALTLENRRLTDTVAGLEAQLGVQQAVLTKAVPAANQVKPQAADAVASLYGNKPPAICQPGQARRHSGSLFTSAGGRSNLLP